MWRIYDDIRQSIGHRREIGFRPPRYSARRDVTYVCMADGTCTLVQPIVNAKPCSDVRDPKGYCTHFDPLNLRKTGGVAYREHSRAFGDDTHTRQHT
jgi:hypothetical protein